jgi:hypothetical protein
MTRVIWVFIIIVVVFIGYKFYGHWVEVESQHDNKTEAAPVVSVTGEGLPGVPYPLEASLRAAKEQGPAAFRVWFKANELQLADPRKAWIELDLCIAIRRDNPAEARKIFARVKDRLGPASPVWPRMKELEQAFQ